nr:tRNA lysidine(34) synthetase TilS [Sneathiella chungangensis]
MAVAVSGGSDSMALALLAAPWAEKAGVELTALTVDHGLRPAAASEAKQVAGWLGQRGLKTRILTWTGPHPETGIQEAAREARYDLMASYCDAEGIGVLLLGHQLEDQLETLLMRLSKGSGLEGLAAMQTESRRGSLRLLRPLLGLRRDLLREYLHREKQAWIDDPSNENPVFTRTRVGAVLTELQQLPGSDLEAIALSLARLQRANDSLDQLARQQLEEAAEISPYGFVRLPRAVLEQQPEEIALRMLSILFGATNGGQRLRLQALEQIHARLIARGEGKSATLGGAQMIKSGKDWLFCREPGRAGLPVLDIDRQRTEWLWDNRFTVTDLAPAEPLPTGLIVRALGPEGWAQLETEALAAEVRRLPAKVRYSLPALYLRGEIVAAPGLMTGKQAETDLNRRFKWRFRAFYWMAAAIS